MNTTLMPWVIAAGLVPLARALVANRSTSLWSALWWAAAAWLTWSVQAAYVEQTDESAGLRYFAFCLTGCASVAVLGARRPHAGPWNFVVLSLLAVMLLPFLEALVLGSETFDLLRIVLLGGTILLGVVSYLPTRLGAAALAFAIGCGGHLMLFRYSATEEYLSSLPVVSVVCLALAPWLAWIGLRTKRRPASAADAIWLDFRDRYGLFWGLRVREQFNRAAENAGWPVQLTWNGLHPAADVNIEPALLATLGGLVQRFM